MAKYTTVIVGWGLLVGGVWGMWVTWPLLWVAIQATVPIACVLGGLLAIIVGVEEIRDAFTRPQSPPLPPSSPPSS